MRARFRRSRSFGGQPLLEKEAFKLKKGDIRGVIQVARQYVILYLRRLHQADRSNMDDQDVQKEINADLREKKMRVAMARNSRISTDKAQIDNYLTGTMKTPSQSKFWLLGADEANRGLLDPGDQAARRKADQQGQARGEPRRRFDRQTAGGRHECR